MISQQKQQQKQLRRRSRRCRSMEGSSGMGAPNTGVICYLTIFNDILFVV
jgi:hypothetical protein